MGFWALPPFVSSRTRALRRFTTGTITRARKWGQPRVQCNYVVAFNNQISVARLAAPKIGHVLQQMEKHAGDDSPQPLFQTNSVSARRIYPAGIVQMFNPLRLGRDDPTNRLTNDLAFVAIRNRYPRKLKSAAIRDN